MKDQPRDESEDPNRSIDEDIPESTSPAPPAPVGPATAGPVVAASTPATGDPTVGSDTPSEAERVLEREVKETRARPRR